MKRNFASLEEHEALHVAIFIEERNARIYENFAQMFDEFHDPESKQIAATFSEMAAEERLHGRMLQGRYVARFGNLACALTDADVVDVIEVPELGDGDMFVIGRVSRQQVLEGALAAERHAHHYYAELAALTVDAALRGLYLEMAAFERDHEKFLEDKLAQLKVAAEGKQGV